MPVVADAEQTVMRQWAVGSEQRLEPKKKAVGAKQN